MTLEEIRDELADAVVDLLPEIEVVRIERVVEVEHPGLDGEKRVGGGRACEFMRASSGRLPSVIRATECTVALDGTQAAR